MEDGLKKCASVYDQQNQHKNILILKENKN